jgi:hypothetical protein
MDDDLKKKMEDDLKKKWKTTSNKGKNGRRLQVYLTKNLRELSQPQERCAPKLERN